MAVNLGFGSGFAITLLKLGRTQLQKKKFQQTKDKDRIERVL
jgi:hypothetical protein